jgi:hypothetical protein
MRCGACRRCRFDQAPPLCFDGYYPNGTANPADAFTPSGALIRGSMPLLLPSRLPQHANAFQQKGIL